MVERQEIEPYLQRIDHLAHNIQENFPDTLDPTTLEFRTELTGLLLVSIVANYENCIKKVLSTFASNHSSQFEKYVNKKYEKLNSQIRQDDLGRYYKHFEPNNSNKKFSTILKEYDASIKQSSNKSIIEQYGNILEQRHIFAHSGQTSTTLEEVIPAHQLAKNVICVFYDVFLDRR